MKSRQFRLFMGVMISITLPINNVFSQIVVPSGGCHTENFDGSNPWTFSGSNSSWVWDNPNKSEITDDITGGGNCLILGGNGTLTWVNDFEDSQAESPVYDLSAATNPYLEFWFYWSNENSTNFDEIWMEYSTDGGTVWNILEPPVGTGGCYDQNWYNFTDNWGGASAFAADNSSTGTCAFGGSLGPTGWVQVRKCVATSVGGQSNVRFRFRSDNGNFCNFFGATIDDFTVCDADVTASAAASCVNGIMEVDFTDASSPCPDGWDWDFGDGNTSIAQNPTHTYTSPGIYNVTFTASSSAAATSGCGAHNDVFNLIVEVFDPNIALAGPFIDTDAPSILNAGSPGGTWSANCGACIDAVTGEFDPAVAGVGVWQICYDVGTAPCDESACIDITVNSSGGGGCGLTGTVSGSDPTCFEFSDGSATINISGATGNLTFVITDSAGIVVNVGNSNTANNLNEGWYYFSVTDDGPPCTLLDSIYLEDPGQMDVLLNTSNPFCFNTTDGIAIADTVFNFTGGYDSLSYIWAPNPSGANGIGEDTLANIGGGQYTLIINDENGCTETFDFTITPPDTLLFQELGYEPAYCRVFSYQSGNGVVFAAASGGTPDYDYEWCSLFDTTCTTNTTWGGLNPGWYQITVTDDNGCVLVDSIEVDSLNPIADFTLTSPDFTSNYEGTSPVAVNFVNNSLYYANPNDPLADTTFFWNFGFGNWIISNDVNEQFDTVYTVGGVYTVCLVALNKNGCTDTLCVPITVYDPLAFTPVNVFTPNGDGANDVFTFANYAQAVSEFKCTIVNRWGVIIYEMTDILDSWNGNYRNDGKSCPEGVYFYIYEGTAENGDSFEGQGNIHLINNE